MPPPTRYARAGDCHIAYQIVGQGTHDVVFACEWWSHVEEQWHHPLIRRFLDKLASFSRLIVFDKRGTGLSDPVPSGELPSIEQWMDDLRAVMDAARSERACVLGQGGGGPMALVFAATYPNRTSHLALCNAWCRQVLDRSPWAVPAEAREALIEYGRIGWGTGQVLEIAAPSVASDQTLRDWWGRFQRLCASPGVSAAMWRFLLQLDVSAVLGAIRVPTLVLHRRGDLVTPVEHGRDLAARIPGARLVELPGNDHYHWAGNSDLIADELQEFLTGTRDPGSWDRALVTLVFSDLVSSTEHATRIGDLGWREMLDRHDQIVREQLTRFRGREVKTTGDGFLAAFDGPNRAIHCACAIRDGVRAALNLEVRLGIHTGECELRGDDVNGIAVHIAARVMSSAGPSEVFVSRTVRDLVAGGGFRFVSRGIYSLKGIDEPWNLFAVESDVLSAKGSA